MKTISIIILLLSAGNVFSQSMYEVLKTEFNSKENIRPEFVDFSRIGESDKNCIEVGSDAQEEETYLGIFLFVKHFTSKGPLFPAKTVQKIIISPYASENDMFSEVNTVLEESQIVSSHYKNKKNYWTIVLKKRDDLIFFKHEIRQDKSFVRKYGYCYYY